MIKQGIYTLRKTFPTHGSFWLMSDVGRGSRAAPCSGHDVTGLDINLDFPEAQFGCTARLGSSNMAQDRSPTEKQAPAGQLDGFGALSTHKAGGSPGIRVLAQPGRPPVHWLDLPWLPLWSARAWGWRRTICHKLGTIRFARAAGLTLNYTGLYVQQGRDVPKKIKTFLQQKRVSQWVNRRRMQDAEEAAILHALHKNKE